MKDFFKKHYRNKSTTRSEPNEKQFTNTLKWQLALEYSGIGVWEYDAELNRVFFSDGSKQIIGENHSGFGENPNDWNDRVHLDDQTEYFQDFQDHLENRTPMYENEHRVICADGTYKWIRDRGKVVEWTSNGQVKRIIGTHTDITSRIKKEEQLETYLQLITKQNKRLHNFTHIVSHNLKTHIGNFKNILEFFDEAKSETEKDELMEHLNTISNALTNTIVDLDDIINIKSKSDTSELNENFNVYDCAQNIIEGLALESETKAVSISNYIAIDDDFNSNKSYFESILYNLISNGIKYSSSDRKSEVILKSDTTPDTLKIIITDNGIGIDLDKFEHQLFEMYQTFHGTHREDSKGVGLYITKTQIEALGGTIAVESKLNEGSTFTLTFKRKKHSK